MNELQREIEKLFNDTKNRLNRGSVKLSTCGLWRQGFYHSNKLEAQAVPFVAESFKNNGHKVSFSVSHQVEDYEIFPKVDLSNL